MDSPHRELATPVNYKTDKQRKINSLQKKRKGPTQGPTRGKQTEFTLHFAGKPCFCIFKTNTLRYRTLVDNGADVSLISRRMYGRLQHTTKTETPRTENLLLIQENYFVL